MGLCALCALVYLIVTVPPTTSYDALFTMQLSVLPVFHALLFLFLFGISSFLLRSKIHGVLIGLVVVIYLLFRQNDLTHPFFALMLAALFLVLELLFSYKK